MLYLLFISSQHPMTEEDIRDHCLSKPGATEGLPFGNDTLVFKTAKGKIFLLLPLDAHPITINVKCDPAEATSLRENYLCWRKPAA